jgi:hypothetical protein
MAATNELNELKEKSKKQLEVNEKRKMGISEMFGDQPVGKPVIQQYGDTEIQQTAQLDSQLPINPVTHASIHPEVQPASQTPPQQAILPSQQATGQPAAHPVDKPEIQAEAIASRQSPIFSSAKSQRISTIKTTFNIREDIHKAFCELYAHRILKGKPTEKSEMICEAIQLLLSKERKDLNN